MIFIIINFVFQNAFIINYVTVLKTFFSIGFLHSWHLSQLQIISRSGELLQVISAICLRIFKQSVFLVGSVHLMGGWSILMLDLLGILCLLLIIRGIFAAKSTCRLANLGFFWFPMIRLLTSKISFRLMPELHMILLIVICVNSLETKTFCWSTSHYICGCSIFILLIHLSIYALLLLVIMWYLFIEVNYKSIIIYFQLFF